MYPKRDQNANDIKLMSLALRLNHFNKNLADAGEATMGEQDEEPITTDKVDSGIDEKIQTKIRNMLRKHGHLW